ncbi:MAG: ABC transporter permease [Aridibacter famidurans]|nr:ABC transporter permease [Aridibacter famidurans]
MSYEIRINARGKSLFPDLKEIYEYREVLSLLIWRDIKVRYKQTLLGIGWVIVQPLASTLILTLIFSRFARFESETTPYALIALCGFTFWTFVNPAVLQASNSLVYHEQLVTKIFFPRLIVPSASVFGLLPDILLTIPMLVAVTAFFGVGLGWQFLLIVPAILHAVIVALGVSTVLSALNVRFRDVKFVIPFLLQVWMFLSPVFYPSEWVPDQFRAIVAVNPLTATIDLARFALLDSPIEPLPFSISIVSSIVLLVAALTLFRALEDDFADQI